MTNSAIQSLLEQVAAGNTTPEQAFDKLRSLPFEDLGFAKVDHHRALRQGFPEVIYCAGKTPEQVGRIAESMLAYDNTVLATRADQACYEAIRAVAGEEPVYNHAARTVLVQRGELPVTMGSIAVVSAGTSDQAVAEEAAETAAAFGNEVDRIYDVGVAGIHRLFARMERIRQARVVIVVAGMEGALASVVGGLVDRPVIAVPTSVGYGASFGGLSALLTMLNSCASGVAVVNIDNGFGAGYIAGTMNRA